MQALREEIRKLFSPVLERHEVDFVDLELRGSAKNVLIKVFVDIPGGIKIAQCAALSNELRDVLDIANLIEHNYRLEVSSPGLDRPLRTERDFFRNIGREVELRLGDVESGVTKMAGVILDAKDGQVIIRKKDGETETIPVAEIKKALLQIKWS